MRPFRHRSARTVPALLFALAALPGCQKVTSSAAAQTSALAQKPTPITLVRPTRGTIHRLIEQPGTVDAFQQTPIYARIAGYVDKVHHDIGDRVKEGELLAELSVPEVVARVERKKAMVSLAAAGLEQARKQLAATEAGVKSAEAGVQEAESGRAAARAQLDFSESQLKRIEGASTVFDKNALDEARFRRDAAAANLEQVEAKVNSAKAFLVESQAKRDRARADVAAAVAQQEVAGADRDEEAALLAYARIIAPYTGVVTRRSIDKGHFVQPAPGGARTEPLFVVVQADPVRVYVRVAEGDVALVRDGMPARIRVQALDSKELEGKVTRTSWSLRPEEHTLVAEIDLPNATGTLRPGNYVNAVLVAEKAGVWRLPATAVITQADQSYCFRVDNGKAVRTPIRTGIREEKWIEVQKKQTRKGETTTWQDFDGSEEVVADAKAASDGQKIE